MRGSPDGVHFEPLSLFSHEFLQSEGSDYIADLNQTGNHAVNSVFILKIIFRVCSKDDESEQKYVIQKGVFFLPNQDNLPERNYF